jgi:hypothetical protein
MIAMQFVIGWTIPDVQRDTPPRWADCHGDDQSDLAICS